MIYLAIAGRSGRGRVGDVALFLVGGLVVYALEHFFGFVILRIGPYVFWYLMMMFSIGMVSILTAAAIAAIIAAGLSLIVTPARRA